MKKLLSFVLAAAMTAFMAVTAFAVEYNTVSKGDAYNAPSVTFSTTKGSDALKGKEQKNAITLGFSSTTGDYYNSLSDFQKDYSFSYKIKSGPVNSVYLKQDTDAKKFDKTGVYSPNPDYKKVYIAVKTAPIAATDVSKEYEIEVTLRDKKSGTTLLNAVKFTGLVEYTAERPAYSEDPTFT